MEAKQVSIALSSSTGLAHTCQVAGRFKNVQSAAATVSF